MGICQLGSLRWRVDPNNVSWAYQVDTAVIDTLGGQVVQILGATLSDLVVTGDFGMRWNASSPGRQRGDQSKQSWLLANNFHARIKQLMDAQMSTPFMKNTKGGHKIKAEATQVPRPLVFSYHDGIHDWQFKVLVKGLADGVGDGSAISYSNGKFNHTYQLTLFIVQADSAARRFIATDAFLSRIADGIGWKRSNYHGAIGVDDVQSIIMANGGSIEAMLTKTLGGQKLEVPGGLGVASTTPTGSKATAQPPGAETSVSKPRSQPTTGTKDRKVI